MAPGPIQSTQIVRVDAHGREVPLVGTSDDDSNSPELKTTLRKTRDVLRQVNRNAQPMGAMVSGNLVVYYVLGHGQQFSVAFVCVCDKSFPKGVAISYLKDLQSEFSNSYPERTYSQEYPPAYPCQPFESYISKTRKAFQEQSAPMLEKLNSELNDVRSLMSKNIEDLVNRGDSLERMGDMSSRLREESAKYRRAAVRINWELLLKQYGPVAALALIILVFIWWRFF